MVPFGDGWAVALNGVVLTSGCSGDTTADDLTPVQNLIVNPSFEVDLATWERSNAAQSTVVRDGDESYSGSWSAQLTASATTASDIGIELIDPTSFITAIEGDHVWGSGWFLIGDPATLDAEASISFYDDADVLISTETGTAITLAVGIWARATVDALAPALTASVQLTLNFTGGATNTDVVGWIDAAMLTVGDVGSDWFDGDSQDTSTYGYAWDGTENESTSTRTPCALIYGTTVLEALTDTPKGLGHPDLRTEDTTYAQRDGVVHWNDWYGPRFVTLPGVTLHPQGHCEDGNSCLVVRQNRSLLSQAWKRQCNDIELVLYPPCEAGTDIQQRVITGPYGVVGRPTVFDSDWQYRDEQVADALLMFRATDHRAYVLDPCGTPGLYEVYEIPRETAANVCANLPMCFDGAGFCFDQVIDPAVEPTEVTIYGTECVNPTITLYPGLTRPRVTNYTTSDWIGYNANIVDEPVIINTEFGTATQGGESVTHNLIGSLIFKADPGEYEIGLVSQSQFDDGYAEWAYRPTVIVM